MSKQEEKTAEQLPTFEKLAEALENAWRVSGEITVSGRSVDALFNVRLALSETVGILRKYAEEAKKNAPASDTQHKGKGAGTA